MKVLVVGGGIAGLCSALDLTLRGVDVVLVERDRLGSGTTTRCAGMLHSGARYLAEDEEIAEYCQEESRVLRQIIPFAINASQRGIFIVLPKHNSRYVQVFEDRRRKFGIDQLSRDECLALEPTLNRSIQWGYETDDFVFNPFVIVEAYRQELIRKGVGIFEKTKIQSIQFKSGRWYSSLAGEDLAETVVDAIINATGAHASELIAFLKGQPPALEYIHGSMAVLPKKVAVRVLSICDDTRAGNVVIPSGQKTLIGSTWHNLSHNHPIDMTPEDKVEVSRTASTIISEILDIPISSSFTGIRVYPKSEHDIVGSFKLRRNFTTIDHPDLANVVTILPGKLGFGRLAAEQAVDTLLRKNIGVFPRSRTREYVLREPTIPANQLLQ